MLKLLILRTVSDWKDSEAMSCYQTMFTGNPPVIMPIDEQDKGNAARSEEQNSILSSDVGTVKLLILSTVLLCDRLIKRTQCLCSAFHDSTLSGKYLS